MNEKASGVAKEFDRRFGRRPTISRAPGRVNLIGEHTDYNDGFVMPAALEFATLIAAAPRPDRRLNLYSMTMGEARAFDLDEVPERGRRDWSDYVFGVAVILERSGYSIIEAASGTDALALAEQHDGPIQLLVTDVVMPGMDGPTLAGKLQQVRPDTRVLYLSGYAGDEMVRHGVEMRSVAYLPKPFTPDALAQKVREVLDAR